MDDHTREYWSLSPEEKRSRHRFHGLHFATAILMFCGLIVVFFDKTLLDAMILPIGLPMLGVSIYSLVKLPGFAPPRWRETTITSLLIPGCLVPLIGLVSYLLFSLVFFFTHDVRPTSA